MGIADPWPAYCFDEAVFTWGAHVESEMSMAEESVKGADQKMQMRQNTLTSLLTDEPLAPAPGEAEPAERTIPKGKFADPAAAMAKR